MRMHAHPAGRARFDVLRRWATRSVRQVSLAEILGLFVVVTVLRWFVDGSGEAAALLYVVPISLAALRYGRRRGLFAAAVGAVAFVVLAAARGHGDLDLTGWAGPLLAMVLVGGLVGHHAEVARQRGDQSVVHAERTRCLEELCAEQRSALTATDSIVQQLAAARWMLETGKTDEATSLVTSLVVDGISHVSQGLSASDLRLGGTEPGA